MWVSVYVWTHKRRCPRGPEEKVRWIPWSWRTRWLWATQHGFRERNSWPLQEQQAPLTAQPSLHLSSLLLADTDDNLMESTITIEANAQACLWECFQTRLILNASVTIPQTGVLGGTKRASWSPAFFSLFAMTVDSVWPAAHTMPSTAPSRPWYPFLNCEQT